MRALAFLAAASVYAQTASVDYQKDVAPILERSCARCHNASQAAGVLQPSSARNIYARAVLPSTAHGAMPPGGPRLPQSQLDILKRWSDSTPAPAAAPAKQDEREAVRRIHDRIAARAAGRTARYDVTIPGTTISYTMVPVPAGSFLMGSTGPKDEQPPHQVRLDAFWMQSHEVTWDEYRLFMFPSQDETVDAVSHPTRPYIEMSFGMGIHGFPAISMTQHAANKYAEWLSAKTGEFYRLPTEAEWEYACRAGAPAPDAAHLAEYAWYADNSHGKYQPAATRKPNAWGLYDMLGNVMEWTLDQYAPYHAQAEINPWVPAKQPYPQAVRGGSWNDPAPAVSCTARVASDSSWKQQDPQLPKSIWYHTDAQWLGFRLVRPAKIPGADAMFRYWNNGVEHDEQ